MKRSILTYLFLTTFFSLTFCQVRQDKGIKKVIDKKTYDYIPLSFLKDTGIIGLTHPIRLEDKRNKNTQFEIYWHSICNDGYYCMTITPEQIYFTSAHDNPNPNLLYWVFQIDNMVYRQIINGFQIQTKPSKKDNPQIFSYFDKEYNDKKLLPHIWNDTTSKQFEEDCEFTRERQIDKFFNKMNQFINDKNKVLDKKKRVYAINSIYYGWNNQIIEDWQPKIFYKDKIDE